jgi:hypothetical protein
MKNVSIFSLDFNAHNWFIVKNKIVLEENGHKGYLNFKFVSTHSFLFKSIFLKQKRMK